MKTKLLILISLIALSCKKDEIKQTSTTQATCNCYERHEGNEPYLASNGSIKVGWLFKFNTTSQPDLCAKETGEWVYSGNAEQFRFKVICQ
jgi:hypothetical protein